MAKNSFPNKTSLRTEYDQYLSARTLIAREIEERIEKALLSLAPRPRVKGRIKSFRSYFKKYIRILNGGISGKTPKITDLIGIRIICPFLEDLAAVEELLKEHFKVIDVKRKGGDHTFREFGYESIHLHIAVPDDVISERKIPEGETVEIQIRTLLQDAWAEVEHELVYKAEFTPFDSPRKRKLAAVNASLVLADIVFQEIRSYQRGLYGELGKRKNSFFKKVEESTDVVLLSDEEPLSAEKPLEDPSTLQPYWTPVEVRGTVSVDELLVKALTAHNKNWFSEAIKIYTKILDMNLEGSIRSLIYKHRGMAFFARSNYEEAVADFSESMKLDPASYKAAYYEGIVLSVLQRFPEAVEAFNRSLEIHPYQPYCLFRRGQVFYHLEDYPKALGDCEAALAQEHFHSAEKFRTLVLSKLKM